MLVAAAAVVASAAAVVVVVPQLLPEHKLLQAQEPGASWSGERYGAGGRGACARGHPIEPGELVC